MTDISRTPRVGFAQTQAEFAAYIRNPAANPAPADVPQLRMAMYRELFVNNINGFLSSTFPVLRSVLADGQWLALVEDFFANHACTTPHFSEIPEEFLAYLQHGRKPADDLPFMLELAHYEWVEMALSIAHDEVQPDFKVIDGQSLITLSPLAWPLVYQYPVHKIAPVYQPLTPPAAATFLVVYRDQEDEIQFLEITPITYRLLEIIQEQAVPVAQCLQQIADESQHPDPVWLKAEGLKILQELVGKAVVLVS